MLSRSHGESVCTKGMYQRAPNLRFYFLSLPRLLPFTFNTMIKKLGFSDVVILIKKPRLQYPNKPQNGTVQIPMAPKLSGWAPPIPNNAFVTQWHKLSLPWILQHVLKQKKKLIANNRTEPDRTYPNRTEKPNKNRSRNTKDNFSCCSWFTNGRTNESLHCAK